jgi:hypothetical protein
MARLPISGVTMSTPFQSGPNPRVLSEADLHDVLADLCPETVFAKSDVEVFYSKLKYILGLWSAEHNRLDIAPLAKTLMAMNRELDGMSRLLSGHETGLHERHDIEVVSQLATILALDPEVGSRQQADKLITSFRGDAAKLAHACLIAAHDLRQQVGKDGRPRLDWYDDFTALLLEIAGLGGVEPQLGKDRITGAAYGWLLDAAQALETFFDPHMRSPSKEACGKRLERSMKTLKQRHRQNQPSV